MQEQDNSNKTRDQLLLECRELRRQNSCLEKKIKGLEHLNQKLETKINHAVEKSRNQEQMIMQQTKLAAMGQMVAAIAHQWRQPLTSIGFIVQNIKAAHELGKPGKNYMNESVKKAMEQIRAMSETIDQLGDFLKPEKEKKYFDVITTISETFSLLHSQLRNNSIQVRFNKETLTKANREIEGFLPEFKQVLINIINNGIYAIKKKIEKGLLKEKQGEIIVDVRQKEGGNKIVIQISNNGLAIPDPVINRIFEPFYTTRENGQGKGIGLYMAKIIIEVNMKGKVYARNIKNGAAFFIELNVRNDHCESS